MKRIAIYYFTGTGNTWWVGNELKRILTLKGYTVDLFSIDMVTDINEEIEIYDQIVFGFPIYGSTAPSNVMEFIDKFPKSSLNQKITVFGTHGLVSGDSAYYIGKEFMDNGYDLRQTRHFIIMNNFRVPKFKSSKPRTDHKLDRNLNKASKEIQILAEEIVMDKKHIIGNNILGSLLGKIQRKHIDKAIKNISKDFEIDKEKCINCGKCERICPTNNITKNSEVYNFGEKCILCLRCYSQCPTSAILIGKDTEDEFKYPRYKGPIKNFNIEKINK